MEPLVLDFGEVDQTMSATVGGKGANLGELSRMQGISVPDGFCVTTEAFRQFIAEIPGFGEHIDRIANLEPNDSHAITTEGSALRQLVEGTAIPSDVTTPISETVSRLGSDTSCAVRSSATAEDSPTASFAGLGDTFLNTVGTDAILAAVRQCWASLFTDRSIAYRLRNGFQGQQVQMAVLVQRMVSPRASGVLFTADPVSRNRKVTSIEATLGLGEGLVSGRVTPDSYTVRDGQVVHTTIATERDEPVLTNGQVIELAGLGRLIEEHFGTPQDVEWCLAGAEFSIVQSRPITTLFPIPEVDDDENHVYVSVGHQQMMTDAMKPLGLSVWQLTSPAPMRTAGGRLFVDVTQPFRSPASRAAITEALGKSDPLIRDALEAVIERDFVPLQTETQGDAPPGPPSGATSPLPTVETDPAVVDKLIELYRAANRTAEREISTKSGAEVFEFVINDIGALRQVLFDPRSHEVFSSAMEASFWLNDHMLEWLSEPNAADTLTQSVPNNITSEMGLALLDVADVVRSHPDVEDFLRTVEHDDFLDGLAGLDGGPEVRDAIEQYLDLYGVRCVGEIDITRPRWNEQPGSLVPLILSNVDNTEPGAAQRLFEQGLTQATAKEQDLLARLADLPEGEQKVVETKWHIDRVRTFIGYREYPKYAMIWRYFTYKKAMLAEAGRMVDAGVLRQVDDIFFLTLQELHEVALSHQADHGLIADRRAAFDSFHNLTPPRVLTSEGECLSGTYRRDDLPEGALAGVAVSSGTVEGRARVITEMANASIEPGDILVTAHTDPSWAPLFVAVSALVTEVGGTMTHGAVVAREYGLPAVVGVEDATRLITDGQRIRVNGSDGWVELLP